MLRTMMVRSNASTILMACMLAGLLCGCVKMEDVRPAAEQEERVRKQAYTLTEHDLQTVPVWEFALDEKHLPGQDSATVRPYDAPRWLSPIDGVFLVRAAFTLADGSRVSGYLMPPPSGETTIEILQPCIVTARGHVPLWHGLARPEPALIAGYYTWLGKAADEVFPLRFTSSVALIDGPIAGTVGGFQYLEDIGGAVREVR